MTRDKAIDIALKALSLAARRSRQFSNPDGGKAYQEKLKAIEVLTQMQGDLSALPMFTEKGMR